MSRSRGRPEAVDRDTLIAATLRMIDADGIAAVTMRRLAAELGVSPMAAYRHVDSKDELLRIAAAHIVSGIHVPPTGSWQADVAAFFGIFHDRLLGHPGVAGLFAGQTFLSDVVYEVSEPVFASLLAAGFEPETAVSLFMACASCGIGAAVLESAQEQLGDNDQAGNLVPTPDRYPSVASIIDYVPNRQPAERHAEALGGIVRGYATLLPKP